MTDFDALLDAWADETCTLFTSYSDQRFTNSAVSRPDLLALVKAAHAAGRAECVPDGWQLVPVEPTEAMLKKLTGFDFKADFDPSTTSLRRGAWKMMLDAAPKQETPTHPAPLEQTDDR